MDKEIFVKKLIQIIKSIIKHIWIDFNEKDMININKLLKGLKISYHDCLYALFYIFKIKPKIIDLNKNYKIKKDNILNSGYYMFIGALINAYEYRRKSEINIREIKIILNIDENNIFLIKTTFIEIINKELMIKDQIFNKLLQIIEKKIKQNIE